MFGGGQRVALDLLEQSVRRPELDLRLILLGCREQSLKRYATAIIDYNGAYNSPLTLFGTAQRLRRSMREYRPQILHTHGWDADIIGWLATCGTGTQQICHLHITPDWLRSSELKHRVRRSLTRFALSRRGTRVIAVAEAVREHWRHVLPRGSDQTIVIHNGVDTDSFRPRKALLEAPNLPVIGTAARLMPSKGIENLLQALKLLSDEGLRPVLRIAGAGPLRADLEQLAGTLGLRDNVKFLGRVANMPEFYRSIDLFALPSVAGEGLPLAIIEAMATGLPVVATRVGGAAELICNGAEGFVVGRNDPAGLAQSLRLLLVDLGLRQRLGQSARRRAVNEFSMIRFADGVFDVYRSMCRFA
jgi:glycosyltransferase involved in cell wall biosynthesis